MTALERAVTDADLRRTITELADVTGWRWHHETDSRRTHAGWPDLVLLNRGRVVVIECKRLGDKIRPTQQAWLDAWAETGAEVWVCTALNLDEVLASLRRRR